MEFVLPVINEKSSENFSDAFGISKERCEELGVEALKKYEKAQNLPENKKGMNRSYIVNIFVSCSKNIEEVAFMACQATSLIEESLNPFTRLLDGLGNRERD